MARANEISFKEFRRRYNTEDACREELFRLRFPNGFVCPKCGCVEFYPIRNRNTYQCRSCRHQTSVTAGTVMYRTHLPLPTWFWAIYLCATDKRGISAILLSRTLGICYESVWYLLDRIRCAMGQRDAQYLLSGIVEMDDGYKSYLGLENAELMPKKYETGDLHWLHKAISNLKTCLKGTYHGRCTKLQAYLDEYCFRFNRRMTGDQIFMHLTRAVATSCAMLR